MGKILATLIYFVAFALPVYLFDITYKSQFSELDLNSGGIYYLDALIAYLLLSLLFAILVSWLSNRFRGKRVFSFIVIFGFMLFYMWMCFFIADISKHLLGTTWSYGEIFGNLVFSQWYFYIFGSIGIALFYLLLNFKTKHITQQK